MIKSAAQFFIDTLVEEPKHNWLVTCPSISPEMGPQLGPQGGAPVGAVPLGTQGAAADPGVTLQQLRDAMRRAGLLTAKQVAEGI